MLNFIKKNQLLKVLSYNWIAVMVQFISGFISIKTIAYFLGTEGIVFLGNFKNFNTTIKTFSTLGFDNGITKLISEHQSDKNRVNEIISTSFLSRMCISLIISISLCLFANYFSLKIIQTEQFKFILYILAILLPLHSINTLLISVLNGFQKFKNLIHIKIASTIIGLVISITLIWQDNLEGALIGTASIESIIIIVTLILYKKSNLNIKISIDYFSKKHLNILLQFSLMTLVSALIIPFSHFLIRNHISTTIDINSAGYWEALNRISSYYLIIVSSGLSMYYLPKLSAINSSAEFRNELLNYFKVLVPLFIIGVTIIYILREPIVLLILNKEFLPVKDLFLWQIIGDIFRVSSLAFSYQILAKAMTKAYLFLEVLYYIIYVFSAQILITKFHLEGVVFSYTFVNLLNLLLLLLLFRKKIFYNN